MIENVTMILTPDVINQVTWAITESTLVIILIGLLCGVVGYLLGSQNEFKKFRHLAVLKKGVTVEDAINYLRETE